MSDIEIVVGDFWQTKSPKIDCEITEIEEIDGVTWINSYSEIDGEHDSDTKESFLRDYVFLRKGEQGRKDDSAKRRYSLLPKGTVNSVVDVLEFGSKKYADNNWQKVPDAKTRYYDAAMRHLDAWFNGDLKDAETGLPHLAHAMCCLMFLMWFDSE